MLGDLRASSPDFTVANVWVYPAKGFAVVTFDVQQVKANPALRLAADACIQLAMVLRFEGESIAEIWTYLNRELPQSK